MNENRYAHRQSGEEIRFLDADGKPLAAAEISIRQVSSAFLLGCGALEAVP